ncbi:alkaline phosphatase family protein [Pareuzebyella sediminis]|uniref:alkaline phosphatase family protein n=1 Tax=Pareuzebyella sediminis TaxID=2607998 RepID=UPI0018E166B5|nr:alkaline phosphatase family protein [Pareuzebyella sediminis]
MLTKFRFHYSLILTIALTVLWSLFSNAQEPKGMGIEHVIVVGFDGLSPDGLQNAQTPMFDELMRDGASTLHARAVLPTSSSSNWASMIMGAGPEQHGITSNAWERDNFTLPAVTQGEDFLFPTIFRLIDHQIQNAEIGAIYHWSGFGRLFEKNAVDFDRNPKTEDETASMASQYLKDKQAHFTFIHFDHVDHAGHEFGHGSPEYYKSVEKADALLKLVMQAIETSGIGASSLVIVSADHGGMGKGHGGESLQEIEIPFIIWGKSIKKGHKIEYPVYQYDNAATVAFALGIKTPVAWIGKPVTSAFEGLEVSDDYPILEQLKQPIILPEADGYKKAGGLFTTSATVKIKNPNTSGKIRYTTDGSFPSKISEPYNGPFEVDGNTVVKSAVFIGDNIRSLVAEAFLRIKPRAKEKPVRFELFYLDQLSFIPELDNKKPDLTGHVFEITSDELKDKIKRNTAVRFSTKIKIEKSGRYTFYTRSDDGSKLIINEQVVVDNDGDHGVQENGGTIELKAGEHDLEVLWFNGGGDGWLDIFIEADGLPKQILPTTMLTTKMR